MRCSDPFGSSSGTQCEREAKWWVPNALYKNLPPLPLCGIHARGSSNRTPIEPVEWITPATPRAPYCYLCANDGHTYKDCPDRG